MTDPDHGDAWTNLTQASRANLNLSRALEARRKSRAMRAA